MLLENHSSHPVAIVSASTDVAAEVGMRELKMPEPKSDGMAMGNGMDMATMMDMSMNQTALQSMMTVIPLKKIEIPAGGKVMMEPNGIHMTLLKLKARPNPGDEIKVILKLQDGTSVPVVATVLQ